MNRYSSRYINNYLKHSNPNIKYKHQRVSAQYHGLIKYVLGPLANKIGLAHANGFWDEAVDNNKGMRKYAELNAVNNYITQTQIAKAQNNALKELQKEANKKPESIISDMNQFLEDINNIPFLDNKNNNISAQELTKKIFENLGNAKKITNASEDTYHKLQALLSKAAKGLEILRDSLNKDEAVITELEIINNALDELEKYISVNFNTKDLNRIRSILNANLIAQGNALQSLGIKAMNEYFVEKGLDFIAYDTGSIRFIGQNTSHKRPVPDIVDLRAISKEDANKKLSDFASFIKIPSKYKDTTLKELLDDLSKPKVKKIILTADERIGITQLIEEITQLGVQAKSGKKQKPYNNNSRYSVKIKDYTQVDVDGVTYDIGHYFELLQGLKQEGVTSRPRVDWNLIRSSDSGSKPYYKMMANLGLASQLSKALGLSLKYNQILLTSNGFKTYYDWYIEETGSTKQHIFKIKESITIDDNTLETKHNITDTII